mgnify:CR=1 FL=1
MSVLYLVIVLALLVGCAAQGTPKPEGPPQSEQKAPAKK